VSEINRKTVGEKSANDLEKRHRDNGEGRMQIAVDPGEG